jgi:(E)-4-hydroxy-3-methylbut-2-enyl-diphosphate synthase
MVAALVEWAQIIAEGGVEEALRRKDDSAAAEAEADRAALLDEKGDDANHSEERIQLIRKLD